LSGLTPASTGRWAKEDEDEDEDIGLRKSNVTITVERTALASEIASLIEGRDTTPRGRDRGARLGPAIRVAIVAGQSIPPRGDKRTVIDADEPTGSSLY